MSFLSVPNEPIRDRNQQAYTIKGGRKCRMQRITCSWPQGDVKDGAEEGQSDHGESILQRTMSGRRRLEESDGDSRRRR
jgi:hypothetical protein